MKIRCPGEWQKTCGQEIEAIIHWTDTAVGVLSKHPNCRRRYIFIEDCEIILIPKSKDI